jgi:hypothetical protein
LVKIRNLKIKDLGDDNNTKLSKTVEKYLHQGENLTSKDFQTQNQ